MGKIPSEFVAIDPGPVKSAYAYFDGGTLCHAETLTNDLIARRIDDYGGNIVYEMIACYGMAVGAEVFETCVWIGRFIEVAEATQPTRQDRIYRREVKIHLCGSMKAKDANVRQAIIDLYGGKAKAIGTKKNPGPLYGVKGDEWAAIGVGLTYLDKQKGAK